MTRHWAARRLSTVLMILVLLVGGVNAQDEPAAGIFTGVVDAYTTSVMVASGVVFDIQNAVVDDRFALRTQIPVEIGFTLANGILSATNLANPSGGTPRTGALVSRVVQDEAGSTFEIGGLRFAADGLEVGENDFTDPAALFEVHFSIASGTFTMVSIAPYEQPVGVVIGRVGQIDDLSLSVGPVTFDVSGVDFTGVEPGSLVRAAFSMPFGASAQATALEVRGPAPAAGEADPFDRVFLAGRVSAQDDSGIVVGGVTIALGDSVRVDEDVQVGALARVTFRRSDDSQSLQPTRVRTLDTLEDIDNVLDGGDATN